MASRRARTRSRGRSTKRDGGLRAGMASNTVGWALCNVDFTVSQEGKVITQPYRALLVLLQESGGWKLVQAHFSNGVPDR